jgi:hypothetical protein
MRINVGIVVFALALSQIACAPRRAGNFQLLDSDQVPEEKAIVYLYRAPSVLGTIDVCNVQIGDQTIGALDAGRYTHVFVEPGETRFESVGSFRAFVTVNTKAGVEYFIRQTWVFRGTGLQPRMENMTRIKALSEIAACFFVESPPMVEASEDEKEDPPDRDQ